MKLRTERAVRLAGGKPELAKLLKIRRQAVQAWGDWVPELRALQLHVLRPDWFTTTRKRK
jgi:hypothetical protein